MSLVLRNQWKTYLDCRANGAADPDFELMGPGFTSISESKNPKEYTRQYVHEQTETTDVTGYSVSLAYSVEVVSTDPVVQVISDITEKELVGTAAQRDVVSVNEWQSGTTEGSLVAYKRTYSVIPDGKGDGTDALVYTGTFRAVGDAIPGQWNPTTSAFTAN